MSSPVINSKLPNVGTTIFTVMSSLANQYNAINLGQGFPDYQMNEELMNKVSEVMQKGWNQYVPMQGYMPLRESVAEKVEYLYQTKIDPDTQITITPGGTYAIYTALTTILLNLWISCFINTAPVGLCGLFSMIAFVLEEIFFLTSSQSILYSGNFRSISTGTAPLISTFGM